MDSLSQISNLGPKTLEKLDKLNIKIPLDLLYHFPTRYIDFSNSIKIKDTKESENTTITGEITKFQNIYTRSHKNIQKATVADNTGTIDLIWFNQPYLSKIIKVGDKLSLAGTVSFYQSKKTIFTPEHGHFHTGKIIAIYPETKGLGSKWFRKTIQTQIYNLTKNIIDPLPPKILKTHNLLDLKTALIQIHTPTNNNLLTQARTRLALDEILSLQTQSFLNKKEWLKKQPQILLNSNPKIEKSIQKLIKSLPFKLTDSQQKVWQEIKNDLLSSNKATNRLLQGDVGSGKTIIALLSCYLAHLNNSISIIIAPTEILALQHFQTFNQTLDKLKVPIHLLTASSKISINNIKNNSIIIGTHAAIFQKHKFQEKTSLLIVDEQHKFGVKQRSFLSSNNLNLPHCLTMTATPIPRTISLTFLGNLDISTIDTLPKNRLAIKTFLVPNYKQSKCYDWIKNQIKNTKCQVFFVCPFIDISETMGSIKAATEEFKHLQNIFSDFKLALIHGKIKQNEREKNIQQFKENKINILVTTPIIEVGIDIPNASIMIIQSAERFGLASLHQLRGRVGRGLSQSYCYLFTESENEKAIHRLHFLESHTNGLKIAEYDLKTRGPGEIFSTIQHGFPSLKIANLSDINLINESKEILQNITKNNPDFDLKLLTKNNSTETLVTN